MRERQFTDCVDIVGSSCKPFEGNRRYISTGAVATDHIDESDVEIVDYKSRPSRADLVVEPETLLFAKMQGTKKTLYVDKENAENIYSTGFFALKAKSGVISTRCLYHLLGSASFLTQKDKNCSGATQKAITNAGLKKIRVSIPDYQLQEAIADQLDKISSVIQMRRSELQKLDDLVKARFVEMFENISYPTERFSRFIESLTSGSRGWAKYCVDDGSEWFITIKNVKNCCISTNNMQPINAPRNAEAIRTKVKEGDLLISITADLGRTGVVSKEIAEHDAYINQHLTCIRVDRKIINPLFIAYYLDSPAGKMQFEAKNQSAVKAGLNFEAINSLMIKVPPIELQNEFETFVQQVDKSKFVESIHVLKLIKEAIAKEVSHDRIR